MNDSIFRDRPYLRTQAQWATVVALTLLAAFASFHHWVAPNGHTALLNHLRDEINSHYGYLDGFPRVNRGPCGHFAKIFREQWNSRFHKKVNIAFIMPHDGGECCHVLVRLPDGSYFDGGNGVMSEKGLLKLHPDSRIDEMVEFDLQLLDQRSGGLDRRYGRCPNYSDAWTTAIINGYLELLPSDIVAP